MLHSKGTVFRSNWNLEMLVFDGEGKTRVPREKPLGTKITTNNKLNSHMTLSLGIKPRPHCWDWEASALTTMPMI